MDILLVSANRERYPYPVFPLGLSFLAGPLAAAGHRLRLVDLCFTDDPRRALEEALRGFAPRAAVVSIRNVDNVTFPATRSYVEEVKGVVDLLRSPRLLAARAPGARPPVVIVGGSGFSLLPGPLFARLDADFGVVGEGEEVLPELIGRLERGIDPARLPGVMARGATGYLPPSPVARIGAPDRSLFQVERYRQEGGMANVQTKRGCPFSCIYCIYPALEGSAVRLRPVPEIVAELRSLVEQGVDYVYFVDDIFNYPPDFAEELCLAMRRERLALNWSAFVNPGFVSARLVDAMVAAGCDAFEFGSESGSRVMLRNLGKSFGPSDIVEASRLCREAGADFAHYLLFGGPGETEASVEETFALMDRVEPVAVIAMTGIRIFPGTRLHQRAVAEGIVPPGDPLLEPVFYLAPPLGESLVELVARRALARRNWVAPGVELNMSDAMLAALRRFGVRGPMWKQVKRLGRSRIRPM